MLKIVTGPTGSGKSDMAQRLCAALQSELANADSFQFYQEIPIIGNQSARGHYVAFRSIQEPLSAGEFSRLAAADLEKNFLWVGTGLYLGALLYGLDDDRRKGTPFQHPPRVEFQMLVLDPKREELYANLNRRVDQMIEAGALEEARKIHEAVLAGKIDSKNPVLKAIGLQHLMGFLRNEMSFERTVELWKRDTRRLAKRQWTWLRKFCPPSENCVWMAPNQTISEFCAVFEAPLVLSRRIH